MELLTKKEIIIDYFKEYLAPFEWEFEFEKPGWRERLLSLFTFSDRNGIYFGNYDARDGSLSMSSTRLRFIRNSLEIEIDQTDFLKIVKEFLFDD